jgi:hypothetical protein
MQKEIKVDTKNGRKIFYVEVDDNLTPDQIMELINNFKKKLQESQQPPQILIDWHGNLDSLQAQPIRLTKDPTDRGPSLRHQLCSHWLWIFKRRDRLRQVKDHHGVYDRFVMKDEALDFCIWLNELMKVRPAVSAVDICEIKAKLKALNLEKLRAQDDGVTYE